MQRQRIWKNIDIKFDTPMKDNISKLKHLNVDELMN